jgi:hypothetical protein
VLGGALQLGEDGQVVARILGERVRDFEQNRAVTLNNQRAIRHSRQSYARSALRLALAYGAGVMLMMLDRGNVRSMSARRSLARKRPPPTLAGSSR